MMLLIASVNSNDLSYGRIPRSQLNVLPVLGTTHICAGEKNHMQLVTGPWNLCYACIKSIDAILYITRATYTYTCRYVTTFHYIALL